jgi:hypothetical protein
LDFGVVPVGQSSSRYLRLINSGDEVVLINEFFYRDTSFYLEENLPIEINPYDSVLVIIKFEPFETGIFTDKINFRFVSDTLLLARQVFVQGRTDPVSVEGESVEVDKYSLSQNYPNPFNPSTNIEFRVSNFGFVSLKVYDVLGNEVATLVNEERPAGEYDVEFNLESGIRQHASGVYFYQLKAGTFIQTKKMIVIK